MCTWTKLPQRILRYLQQYVENRSLLQCKLWMDFLSNNVCVSFYFSSYLCSKLVLFDIVVFDLDVCRPWIPHCVHVCEQVRFCKLCSYVSGCIFVRVEMCVVCLLPSVASLRCVGSFFQILLFFITSQRSSYDCLLT